MLIFAENKVVNSERIFFFSVEKKCAVLCRQCKNLFA